MLILGAADSSDLQGLFLSVMMVKAAKKVYDVMVRGEGSGTGGGEASKQLAMLTKDQRTDFFP